MVLQRSSKIIRGPEDESGISHETLGRVIKDFLKERSSDEIAIIEEYTQKSFTYGEIFKKSIQLADSLRKLGIKNEDVISLVSENTLEYCLPVFAAIFLGITINLLNPVYTIHELENALQISKPKLVFITKSQLQNVVNLKKKLDFIETIIVFGDAENDVLSFDAFLKLGTEDVDGFELETFDIKTQPALIMCSSGTTGLPKGAVLTQENVRTALVFCGDVRFVNITNTGTSVLYLPTYHIFGLLVLFASIIYGMKLVILKSFRPEIFLQVIEKYRVDRLYAVPTVLLFLAKSELVKNYDISSIKDIFCGAAPLREEVQRALGAVLHCPVRQAYGLTETIGCTTVEPPNSSKTGGGGMLVPLAEAKVVDVDTGKLLGPNESGELCFRSPACMKCYAGNEKETKEIFDSDGFLHSGDLGYYDEDGYFFIVDRLKELIKYKGFQVAPAELEALLTTHDGVKEAAVIGIPDERVGELPKAFVVRQPLANISEQELIDFVAEHLSAQKRLYGGVEFVESLPKTSTGKISRKELRTFLVNGS